jgi:hypothetical protein
MRQGAKYPYHYSKKSRISDKIFPDEAYDQAKRKKRHLPADDAD